MPKVLLVEDDTNLREIFEMRLVAEGYQTVTASNGEEALAVAMKEKPDLIVADIMMPRLSGFEMLETLRSAPEMSQVKVVMMTALGQEEDRARGEKLGVVKYLVKSQVTLEDFTRAVKEVLPVGQSPLTPGKGDQSANFKEANIKESEINMPDDTTSPTNSPAPEPVADEASTNPITGGTAGSDSMGDQAQTTAQEQGVVNDQINDFAGTPPADSSAAGNPPMEPSAPAMPQDDPGQSSIPVTPPPADEPTAETSGDSNAPATP
ncbi:MAG: response regulator [Candidatus Saccharimonadales bacterium]